MKTKGLAIILILAMLILTSGSVYSGYGPPRSTFGPTPKAHPWEDLNNNDGPSGCSPMILQDDDPKVIMIPIFSDFLIWIYIKGVHKESEHQKNSVKTGDNSYQIIFPW